MGEICIHCGEDCGKHPIMRQNEPFYCNGCKTVYQLSIRNVLLKQIKEYVEEKS